ncbi:MAG TPA: TIGR03000 domain-containing protein, partial [Gemmataceae bacterium]|nr:TIGR03000 domain-containing protein [Gemmataceae bacterium]
MVRTQDIVGASVVVMVPSDAKLYFDGYATKQTGETRLFTTPPLKTGSEFYYQLKAEIARGGKTLTQVRNVPVRSGDTTYVDLTQLDPASAPPSATSLEPPPDDHGWPRKIEAEGNTIVIYQPQV